MTPQVQKNLTPEEALELLQAGNERFLKNQPFDRHLPSEIKETASGQYPFAIVLSCIDSRVPTEVLFDQGIGDLFNARIAGNFVNKDILGSMEFACAVAGSKLIVVMGHTSCGAVKGACDHVELGNLTDMLKNLEPAVEQTPADPDEDRSSANEDFVNRVAQTNVELTLERILKESEVLRYLFEKGEIGLVGAMYDVASGKVTFGPLQWKRPA
ncbi:MAG: carbonic anhydrase [Deltaproteobacteria bacterium]|nr:MAG: carbonic anhydrase [Deltaproteobacteria bacterium]